MKKVIIGFIAAISLTAVVSAAAPRTVTWSFKGRYYSQITKAIKISHKGEYDLVRVIDANGQIYEFYTDRGDYGKGDAISVIMDTRGTAKVYDDWVIEAKYDRPDLLRF